MDPDSGARLLYLALLGAFLLLFLFGGGYAIARAIRALLVWGAIGAMLVVGYWLWNEHGEPPAAALSVSGETVILSRARDGHFHAELSVNETPIRFMVDTGASAIVLSRDDAIAAGIDPDGLLYLGRARTANGTVRTASVRLDSLALAGHVARDVPATVSEGELDISLLGMSFLDRFSRIEIAGDEMRLVP